MCCLQFLSSDSVKTHVWHKNCCSRIKIRAVHASHILCAAREPYLVSCMLCSKKHMSMEFVCCSQVSILVCCTWVCMQSSCIILYPIYWLFTKMKWFIVSKHWILDLLVKPIYYQILHLTDWDKSFILYFLLRLVIYCIHTWGDGKAHGWQKM